MRQRPYEHLMLTQNTSTQCSIQSIAAGLDSNGSSKNKTNGLSTILGNVSNLAKFGNIFSNMMKNNQNSSPPQNTNVISNNYPFNSQQQNKNSYTKQAPLPNNAIQPNESKQHQDNVNLNSQNSITAQNFPSINPQFSLETILNPQTHISKKQESQDRRNLQDNKKYVLKQMQLHNDYLSRIPHN